MLERASLSAMMAQFRSGLCIRVTGASLLPSFLFVEGFDGMGRSAAESVTSVALATKLSEKPLFSSPTVIENDNHPKTSTLRGLKNHIAPDP